MKYIIILLLALLPTLSLARRLHHLRPISKSRWKI